MRARSARGVGQLDGGVADRAGRPVERELGRLDVAVQVAVEILGDGEGHERGRSLRVGRQLADLDAAVRAPQRRDPFRAVRGQVVLGEPARRRDGGGDRSPVDRVGAAVGDRLQGPGEVGQAVALAGPRGRPRRPRLRAAPVLGDPRGGRDAVARRVDGAGERRVEPQAPEALGGVGPRPHRAGHRDRARAVGVDGQLVDVGRRAPRAVQAVQLAVEPEQREGVAADAVVGRLADGEHRRRRQRRVDRVAARLERAHARARGQRVARGHHRVGGDRRQAGPPRRARHRREQPFVQHRGADVSGAAVRVPRAPKAPPSSATSSATCWPRSTCRCRPRWPIRTRRRSRCWSSSSRCWWRSSCSRRWARRPTAPASGIARSQSASRSRPTASGARARPRRSACGRSQTPGRDLDRVGMAVDEHEAPPQLAGHSAERP